MNPRQRRGVLLLAIAVIGAGAVFVSVSQYVAEVSEQVGPKVLVYRLAAPVERNLPMTEAEVETVRVPEKWVPSEVLRPGSEGELVNQIAATDLPEGAFLQRGMFRPAPPVEAGQREVTIMIDIEQGVGGKIQRGSVVDVVATFGGDDRTPACSAVVAADVPVVDFGFAPPRPEEAADDTLEDPDTVVPVNFALDPYRAQRLVLAESFAAQVRLLAKSAAPTGVQDPTTRETFDCGPDLLSEPPPKGLVTTATAEDGGS